MKDGSVTMQDRKTLWKTPLHRMLLDVSEDVMFIHANGNCCDNRRSNLVNISFLDRPALYETYSRWGTRERNEQWEAFIGKDGKETLLGTFATEKEAIAARKAAEKIVAVFWKPVESDIQEAEPIEP